MSVKHIEANKIIIDNSPENCPSIDNLIELINCSDQEYFYYSTFDGDYYEIIDFFVEKHPDYKIRTSFLYSVGDSALLLASDDGLSFNYNYMDITKYWNLINKKEFIDVFNGYLELGLRIQREEKTVEIQIIKDY